MNTHTPGPWQIVPLPTSRQSTLGVAITDGSDEQRFIARVVHYGWGDQCHANAKLIAAAPELLDALKELMQATPTPLHNERQIAAFDAAMRLLGRLSPQQYMEAG